MWGKWIGCRVPVAARGRFATAQAAWPAIGDQPGLLGQVGGWDPDGGGALLLGLWADEGAYLRFMRDRHAAVAADSRRSADERHGRAGSGAGYTAIDAAAGEVVLDMPGDAAGLPQALERAALLRVADCRLAPGRGRHFLDVQREVWAPGMAAAGGMLAGVVVRLGEDRHLVATLWSDPAAHRRYADRHLPALRARAVPEDDLRSVSGGALPLEPAWRVLPTGRPRR
ncbi:MULTISPECIES: DUF4937 domain-containing protein [Kitasatospora]|uniref:DUF4937 domain-containing protein n=1 Tax=Kitasatospora setae (strain ATCC 33774 / DSM 43861 / JCM 3304 / KCC A-0304 / NBRC 14216 / KM-6054) TaxID=452652 RepID=E4N538_KITSK|nr:MULTISPECIES: DUF4937 domain-containing protein [Kitasatospora]BAJ26319.1 hypothetical protein KSE_04730 [Kitasatospora setae KM-6054]